VGRLVLCKNIKDELAISSFTNTGEIPLSGLNNSLLNVIKIILNTTIVFDAYHACIAKWKEIEN
jgi:hypothetical protein